jgi:glycosyltransferase involved in cell wall biosynthesis
MKFFFNSWRDTAHPRAGGSEVTVDRLARELVAFGHEVTVAVPRPAESHDYEIVTTGSFLGQYLRSPYTARRDARDADVIVDVANGIAHSTPLWRRDTPVICWVHHVADEQWSDSFSPPVAHVGRFLERRVMPRVYRRARYVAVSESTAAALQECGVDRGAITIIHNGIDLPEGPIDAARSGEPLYVAVSRLMPYKRIDVLLDVWRQVSTEIEGRLVVIGDGPMRAALEANVPPRCELLGRVSDEARDDWLGRGWLFLQTSSREGWGISVIEAASHGTPALALDAPGSRDAIVDGTTGILAEDAQQLVRAWIDLARDPARRVRMGEEARTRAGAYSWESSAKQLEELASEMLLKQE